MLLTFLVILAFLLFAILRELELAGEEGVSRRGVCPCCRDAIEDDWIVCPRCKALLREDCGQCGGQRLSGYGFCPHCGKAAQEVVP